MSVKDRVLLALEENKNNPISGETLANTLNCTRASIWKAIKSLQNEGYEVLAVNNKGYTLVNSSDTVQESYIKKLLVDANVELKLEVRDSVESTNDLLKQYANNGIKDDMVVIAQEQTKGKGRRGRSFYSPKGTGIYISFLLHPDIPVTEAARLTTLAVAAECLAIEAVSNEKADIKWVNDVVMRGKKVSGILTEASASVEDGTLEYVVPGIGINIYEPEGGFPEEIKDIAGAIFTENEKKENIRNKLVAEFVIKFYFFYKDFLDGKNTYLEEYKKRCFVIGKEISFLTPDHKVIDNVPENRKHAKVIGINDECHLHVEYEDGFKEYLSSGEISVRIK